MLTIKSIVGRLVSLVQNNEKISETYLEISVFVVGVLKI